ncbi:hypothetical protein COOONC_05374 [Cooperia oncophora]
MREGFVMSECPGSKYCVRQEWWMGDLKTTNMFCDRMFDIMGNPVALCKSDGTFTSTGLNNIQCTNRCCSSDYCNLPTAATPSYGYCALPLLFVVYWKLVCNY